MDKIVLCFNTQPEYTSFLQMDDIELKQFGKDNDQILSFDMLVELLNNEIISQDRTLFRKIIL